MDQYGIDILNQFAPIIEMVEKAGCDGIKAGFQIQFISYLWFTTR